MRLRPTVAALLTLAASVRAANAADNGAALYAQNCALCHQADAGGAPGQYPPLKGRVDVIAANADGRHYLSDLLVNGMAGAITANGALYVGYMPSFKQLPDATIASILTYLASLGSTTPAPVVQTADIAAARARSNTPSTVSAERKAFGARHTLP